MGMFSSTEYAFAYVTKHKLLLHYLSTTSTIYLWIKIAIGWKKLKHTKKV